MYGIFYYFIKRIIANILVNKNAKLKKFRNTAIPCTKEDYFVSYLTFNYLKKK